MSIVVAIGPQAYAQLIDRLNLKSSNLEKVMETLNDIQPWYFQKSKFMKDVYYLRSPQVGGEFILAEAETKAADYFARTFMTYFKTEGKPKDVEFVWFKDFEE